MTMCRVFSCVVGRGCLLWPVCSVGKTISFCPASSCTPRPNLPVTPGISWFPTFVFQSPTMKKTSLGSVSLEGLVGLHRTVQLQLLQHYWLGHRLGLLWYWMVCLGNEHSAFFESAPKYCILDSCQQWAVSLYFWFKPFFMLLWKSLIWDSNS